jgi:O-antigen ligase
MSWYGQVVIILCVALVLGHYFASQFQPVRWPTKILFLSVLALALVSQKWSTLFVLFSLPLLPELHIQAEHIFKPAVRYFVAYPGIDMIVGLCLGNWIRLSVFERKDLNKVFILPPWPLGLLLFMLTGSAILAITRNLWQSSIDFNFFVLFQNAIRFKLLDRLSDYYPITDLLVYGIAVTFIVHLLDVLRTRQNKDQFIFEPILITLFISAIVGIVQGLTGFGLSENTSGYRPDFWGFGAQAFQPDIHAFAGLMLLGAVGLFGFAFSDKSNTRLRKFSTLIWALSWFALVLAKSKASFIFGMSTTLFVIGWYILKRKLGYQVWLAIFVVILGGLLVVIFTHQFSWVASGFKRLFITDFTNFELLNVMSRYRLELHAAALRMGLSFPIFGMGLGEFFRLSSILEFSRSPLMVNTGGENAHNYFLQTFSEVGLLGVACFALVFIAPVMHCNQRKTLGPAAFAIGAIFLGNIYSHSLIIRENLLLLSAFIALLYSYSQYSESPAMASITATSSSKRVSLSWLKFGVALIICAFVSLFLWREIKQSFEQLPFEYGRKVVKSAKPL